MAESESDADHLLSRSSLDSPFDSSDEIFVGKPRRRLSLWTRFMRAACNPRQYFTNIASNPFGLRINRRPSSRIARALIFLLNLAGILIFILILISITDAILYPSYAHPPEHYELLEKTVQLSTRPGRRNPRLDKIFIASNIINPELINGHWRDSMLQLIDYLDPENVFVSIYENDSGPETVEALQEFEKKLKCTYQHHREQLSS